MKEGPDYIKRDPYLMGNQVLPMGLFYGNMNAVDLWYQKTLAAFAEIDLTSSGDYNAYGCEIWGTLSCPITMLILLDQPSKAASLLSATGLAWDTEGLTRFDNFFKAANGTFHTLDQTCEKTFIRLINFLSFPPGAIEKAEVNKWILSPAELAEMERGYIWFRRWGMYDVTSTGALAFLKLERDDDAAELARLTVAPEQQTEKKTTLVTCHSILGQVAAKRGQMDEADSHFARALDEAKLSRLPMLEVLAARDWKKHALDASGRDYNEAESVIDAACAKMNKTREQIASVLSAE